MLAARLLHSNARLGGELPHGARPKLARLRKAPVALEAGDGLPGFLAEDAVGLERPVTELVERALRRCDLPLRLDFGFSRTRRGRCASCCLGAADEVGYGIAGCASRRRLQRGGGRVDRGRPRRRHRRHHRDRFAASAGPRSALRLGEEGGRMAGRLKAEGVDDDGRRGGRDGESAGDEAGPLQGRGEKAASRRRPRRARPTPRPRTDEIPIRTRGEKFTHGPTPLSRHAPASAGAAACECEQARPCAPIRCGSRSAGSRSRTFPPRERSRW
jgi:hypothetical protein